MSSIGNRHTRPRQAAGHTASPEEHPTKKPTPKSKHRRKCNACGESKPKWLFSSSEYTCIACKRAMYGQGLHAIHTTITNEIKQ